MVSILIPTYRNLQFIDECLNSIKSSISYEILIGVDADVDSFRHLSTYVSENLRVFWFSENKGPFFIKNFLVNEAKYDSIVFFDSDDIMCQGTLESVYKALESSDYARLNYTNFFDKPKGGNWMNDAVIGVKKDVFLKLNGFFPWKCGADTEFTKRLEFNKYKCGKLDELSYYRRLHGDNLTMRKDTGHGSKIRNEYMKYIQQCEKSNNWPNP